MAPVAYHGRMLVDWSVAACPIAGQTVSGDLHLVQPFDRGVLLAVVDGVGHGAEAAAAARSAVTILESHANDSVISLVRRCHEALLESRGVVMTIVSLHAQGNTITWLGVGNVEGRLFRADQNASHPSESVLLRGGLVGYQLPALQASLFPVAPGDLLVLVTDGIKDTFEEDLNLDEPCQQIADHILERHYKGNDDGLVLVARYLGQHHE